MTGANADAAFESLLEFVRDARGFDYTPYKRPSLARRFEKRMQEVGAATYGDYRARLEGDPHEFAELFDTILINVTRFFRDAEAWEALRTEMIPRLVEARRPEEPVRVWSAGCSSGEEAYTAAILLADALGEEAFQARVKIHATDVDEDALASGRHATYGPGALGDLPGELRDRYFEPVDSQFRLRGDLRRAAIFGRNDLLTDPPISHVDLVLCRNTLMYFSREAQTRILSSFHFALRPDGILFLGKAEALPARGGLFVPIDLRRRIFARSPAAGPDVQLFARAPDDPARRALVEPGAPGAGFEHGPVAQLVVDADGTLAAANAEARHLFGLATRDVGRPLHDLEVSYRPLDLRSALDETWAEGRPTLRSGIKLRDGDRVRYLDVHLAPVAGPYGRNERVAISFGDVSRDRALADELERTRAELATAYRELQATVEELETTNEELQSTNEELETTNAELETMNDELRARTEDALRAAGFLTSILQSIKQSVIVLDPELRVTAWSAAAADLWGLRADEVEGQHLMNLDIGLPAAELAERIRAALGGETGGGIELAARNRRGQPVRCVVDLSQLRTAAGDPQGVILVTHAEPLPEEA